VPPLEPRPAHTGLQDLPPGSRLAGRLLEARRAVDMGVAHVDDLFEPKRTLVVPDWLRRRAGGEGGQVR
jgi:hypothetical protein